MPEYLADYHVHLGESCPETLLSEAEQNRVTVLGGLDRGEVDKEKLSQFGRLASERGITFLPSVEYFATLKRGSQMFGLELIGIDIDLTRLGHKPFFSLNGSFDQMHETKVTHLVEWLKQKGFLIEETPENSLPFRRVYQEKVLETAINVCLIAALHPGNQQRLDQLGYRQLAFELSTRYANPRLDYLNAKAIYETEFAFGQPGALPQPTAEDTIQNLHQAGALVSVAHPNYQRNDQEGDVRKILPDLVELGIDGIEVWHAGPADFPLVQFALKHNLVKTGGSDTDKQAHPGRIVGLGSSTAPDMNIPANTLDAILDRKAKLGLI